MPCFCLKFAWKCGNRPINFFRLETTRKSYDNKAKYNSYENKAGTNWLCNDIWLTDFWWLFPSLYLSNHVHPIELGLNPGQFHLEVHVWKYQSFMICSCIYNANWHTKGGKWLVGQTFIHIASVIWLCIECPINVPVLWNLSYKMFMIYVLLCKVMFEDPRLWSFCLIIDLRSLFLYC